MQAASNIDEAAVRSELERILRSHAFEKGRRSQSLLRYLVDAALAPSPVSVKEYAIAVDVFGRAANYDPSVDATVRVEAGRLRGRLREYYAGEGRDAKVVIEIPKGSYVVAFSWRVPGADAQEEGSRDSVAPPPAEVTNSEVLTPLRSREPTLIGAMPGWSSWSWVAAVAVCVGGLLAGWTVFHQRRLQAALSIHSMAVLPLRDLSGAPDGSYLAEGMADELNTELARIPDLRVISRDSVLQERLDRKPLRQIARELNVDTVVEGSILRRGEKVRINAQLTDVRSDRQLWAASVEGEMKDLITLEESLAGEIASHARLAFLPGSQQGGMAAEHPSPQAYDAYLRARYFLDKRDPTHSIEYFQRAIAIDPSFASAYAGLSQALEAGLTLGSVPVEEATSRALAAAHKAIELDPGNGPAYSALGTIEFTQLWDWGRAEKDLLQGIRLSPGDSLPVTTYGLFLDARDRRDEALAQMRRAAVLDPLSFYVSRNLGVALYYARRYDEALQQLNRAKELEPERSHVVDNWISWIYEVRGMRDEAVRYDLAAIRELRPAGDVQALRRIYQTGGWKAYWRARMPALGNGPMQGCIHYQRGLNYVRVEEPDRALASLQQAVDGRCYWMEMITVDPRFDPLRGEPRFAALVRQMNLGAAEVR